MVNVLDCDIVVSEFELQCRNDFYIETWNNLGVITLSMIKCLNFSSSSKMARQIGVQSQVESYQRLKKWY